MRQSQNNRRFYWLPLLCVIWTIPASAQWTTVWTPDSAPAPSSGEGHLGQGSHKSNTNRPPCTEWDEYEREWKKIYDPETQGCCVHPITGDELVTEHAENADLTEVAENLGYCRDGVAGVTFCYNGSKVSTLCPYGQSFHPAIQQCIQEHENTHVDDQNTTCTNCDTKKSKGSAEDKIDGECTAYEKTLRCLLTPSVLLSDVPEEELEFVWNETMRGAEYFCNKDNFPFL